MDKLRLIHESAHTAAAIFLGYQIRMVTVVEKGLTTYDNPTSAPVEDLTLVAMAGPVAQALVDLDRSPWCALDYPDAGGDRAKIDSFCLSPRMYQTILNQTITFCERHWDSIIDVAKVLARHGTLNGEVLNRRFLERCEVLRSL